MQELASLRSDVAELKNATRFALNYLLEFGIIRTLTGTVSPDDL